MTEALRVAWVADNGEVVVWDSADRFVARRLASGTWERASVKVGETAEMDRVEDVGVRDALLKAARAALSVHRTLSVLEESESDIEKMCATLEWVREARALAAAPGQREAVGNSPRVPKSP